MITRVAQCAAINILHARVFHQNQVNNAVQAMAGEEDWNKVKRLRDWLRNPMKLPIDPLFTSVDVTCTRMCEYAQT